MTDDDFEEWKESMERGFEYTKAMTTDTDDALRRELDDTRAENAVLRASLANGSGPCAYCKMPREEWAKCQHGFPGCDRADDAMLCPHVGAELESRDRIAELEAERDAAIKVSEMAATSGGFHAQHAKNAERQRDAALARVAELEAENTSLRAERDELIAKIALSVALKREKAELESEVQRLFAAMTEA